LALKRIPDTLIGVRFYDSPVLMVIIKSYRRGERGKGKGKRGFDEKID
jgi:hypothetical protein